MGQISERTDLLRILLADQDDANAFLFQCGVNRLARPCAFQRIASEAHLVEKLASFRPDIIIAAGKFATAPELCKVKQVANGHPIICAVKTVQDGEAAMAAGAADCVLVSQVDELHACIERQLQGKSDPPYFQKDDKKIAPRKKEGPGEWDLKLQEFDRRVGALLKRLGRDTGVKARKLARVSQAAYFAALREARTGYRALKEQWLLHKQKRLAQSNVRAGDAGLLSIRNPEDGDNYEQPHEAFAMDQRREIKPPQPAKVRILSHPHRNGSLPVSDVDTSIDPSDKETLRALELSFKMLFHASLDLVFLLDGHGSFLHANGAACAMLGVSASGLLGMSLFDFVPVSERPQVSAIWEELLIEGHQKAEMRLQTGAGEAREVYISARSNIWFGVHLLIVRDETELKALRQASRGSEQAA